MDERKERITPIRARAGLTAAQQAAFDAVTGSRGAVAGPFTVLLHRPELASAAEAMGGYLRYRSPLDPMVREAVILTVAGLLDCRFELQAHETLARDAGLDLNAIRSGRTNALRNDVRIAVEIARRILIDHRIPDDLFAQARRHWDEPALVDVIALIGYYSFLAAVLNGFEVVPG